MMPAEQGTDLGIGDVPVKYINATWVHRDQVLASLPVVPIHFALKRPCYRQVHTAALVPIQLLHGLNCQVDTFVFPDGTKEKKLQTTELRVRDGAGVRCQGTMRND